MENLLYVLLGIVWVAYSLYNAKQKAIQKQKQASAPPQAPSQSSPLPIPHGDGKSILEELFRGLTGETSPVIQEIKPVLNEKPVRLNNVSELNQTYPGYTGYKFVTDSETEILIKEPETTYKTQVVHQDTSKNSESVEKFDLRQAVIFSELLNRKYF